MLLYHAIKDNLSQICAFSNHGDLTFIYHYFSFPFFFFNGCLVQKKEVHLGPL